MSNLARVKTIAKNRLEKLTSKEKIYLGILVFLFLFQFVLREGYVFALNTNPYYVGIFSLIGIVAAWIRRSKSRKEINDKSLRSILFNDYNLSSYASLSILSLLYAIFQGIFSGACLGFISFALGSLFRGFDVIGANIGYFLISLILIAITRVLIESTSLIFRVAADISKSVNK
tara:strand:+ start:7122 stop:7643 length:522 start_codon:yes stop_codon:yes gene_type:complete